MECSSLSGHEPSQFAPDAPAAAFEVEQHALLELMHDVIEVSIDLFDEPGLGIVVVIEIGEGDAGLACGRAWDRVARCGGLDSPLDGAVGRVGDACR